MKINRKCLSYGQTELTLAENSLFQNEIFQLLILHMKFCENVN